MWIELKEDKYSFTLANQPWRFNILQWIKDNVLIDSTYNAAPASMKKMVENTFDLQKSLFPDHKVFLVLGDMRELWEISPSKHLELNDSVINAHGIYCVWEEITPLFQALQVQSFEWPLEIFRKSRDAWWTLKKHLETSVDKYVILFKWSQNTIFTEEALKQVLLHQEEAHGLVRQSDDWRRKKERFFAN
jgi:UDP-N-acetylmuramyl pentapeptide synthase